MQSKRKNVLDLLLRRSRLIGALRGELTRIAGPRTDAEGVLVDLWEPQTRGAA
jgi:hypothetical protein